MENRRGISDERAIKLLGGCERTYKNKSIIYYHLSNGEVISIKFSHLYEDGTGYWFGITPSAMQKYIDEGTTHFCLILGYEGILKLPFSLLVQYIETADFSKNKSNGIKHYHVRIKYDEDILLYNSVNKYVVNNYLIYDEESVITEVNLKSKEQIRKEAEKFTDYEHQYIESEKRSKRRKESKVQKERIAKLEDYTCQICGFNQGYISENGNVLWIIHVDHIIDKSKGGGETIDNLWVLCPNCHAKKTFGIIEIDRENKLVKEDGKEIKIRDFHLGW